MSFFGCENITRLYEGHPTIRNITLGLEKGEMVALLGASGVGKSTLFNILAGVDTPDIGCVFFEGEDITSNPGNVSYMLQKDLLLSHKTILENVTLPLIIKGERKESAEKLALGYFKDFGLEGYGDNYPKHLSGGMRQRAALLRTFLMDNKVMLLDEPFSALDEITRLEMQEWYMRLHESLGLTALIVTHSIEEAFKMSVRVYVIAGTPGRIVSVMEGGKLKPESYMFSEDFRQTRMQVLATMRASIAEK